MIATSNLAATNMDRAQERDRSDRLRNRLSGAGGIVPTRPAQPSRRRSGSLDETASQVSLSSNAPTIGSGSHLSSSRVARTGRSRRPTVTFPTTSSSHHSTGSGSDNTTDSLRQRTERHSLKSAMKTPQRPLTPPLPADSTTGPSFGSLSDSQESSRRSIRRRRLSFKEPSTTTQDKRRSMPGGWAERFLPQVTNANALMRREPFARRDSFESDTEDYTDSELSDDTHATTVMSDATVGSPKVQKRPVTTTAPVVQITNTRQAPPTSAHSVSAASAPTKPPGRTLTIEVHPARESEEEVRKREEEKRRRERIEADLRSKIAGLEKRMQAEAEDNARQQQQVQRQIASVAAKQKERQAPVSAPATPAPPAPSRQAPVPPMSRLSPGRTESTPASPQLNAQARPFQPSPRPLSMTAMAPVVPQMNHLPPMPTLEIIPPFLQQAIPSMTIPPSMPPPPPHPMPMVKQHNPADLTLQQQLDAQAAQLASLRATLAAVEAERDENKSGMATLSEQCKTLEAEVRTVRAARSQSEEVTIAKLAACELVRDVLRIKVEGFESEVKTKAMVIEDLSTERDRLAVALEASAAEVAVLTERSRMLEEDRERAHGDMLALKEELVNVRAAAEALEREKAELEGKVVGLQGDLGTAQSKIAELELVVKEKELVVKDKEGVIKEKEDCIEQLKKDGDEVKASNDELKKEVEELASAGAIKDKELIEITTKLADAEATLATSQSSLATLETTLATTAEEKAKEISGLQEKLAAAETAVAAAITTAEANMAAATAEKETEIASLNDKLAAAKAEKEAELASLNEKLAAAEAETTKAQAEIKDLQGKTPEDYAASIAAAAKEKDELASKIAALQAEVESRTAEANDMVTTFATEKAALEADKAAVESERSEIEEARAAAAAEAARLSLHVAQLKAKVEASKNKKTVPTTAAASAAAAVKSTKTVKTKADFFFVRNSQDRGRMQVVKKSELKSSRSSSRTPSAKDE